MDITFVINPGSASKKYSLFRGGKKIFSVLFEHIEDGYGKCVEINGSRQQCESITPRAFESALEEVLLLAQHEGVITDLNEITRVGMRIVAPGTFFQTHRVIDSIYHAQLEKMCDAAPLHVPHTISELTILAKVLPNAICIGVSDSAFHCTIPEYARRYSVPRNDRDNFDLHRFGYHGLSVSSVIKSASSMFGALHERVIVCHVGSGVSVTAVQKGQSIDTTMGFSPTSGLMMSSRAGDLDPGALLYLMKKKQFTPEEAEIYIAKEGGFTGLLGQSDLRIAIDRSVRREPEAQVALGMFTYHIRKVIGAYIAALGGLDALVFTATAAERNSFVRSSICDGLEGLGILLNKKENEACMGRPGIISDVESSVKVAVIHTDEMGEISRITEAIVV